MADRIVLTIEKVIRAKAKRAPNTNANEWLLLRRKVPAVKFTVITFAVDVGFTAALAFVGIMVGHMYQ